VRLEVREQGGLVILTAQGEINFENATLVSEAIRERLSVRRHFVLDLTQVPFMDSTSLGCLLDTLKVVRERDGVLCLAGMADNVRRVFDLLDASRLFPIHASVDEALTSCAVAVAPA
jgi:anti-anti-sigma factor